MPLNKEHSQKIHLRPIYQLVKEHYELLIIYCYETSYILIYMAFLLIPTHRHTCIHLGYSSKKTKDYQVVRWYSLHKNSPQIVATEMK